MTTDPGGAPATKIEEEGRVAPAAPPRKRFGVKAFLLLCAAVVALDLLAAILVPPFPKGG